jgi:hypothetical protein
MADFESLDTIMERMRADMNAHYERMIAIIKTCLEEMEAVAEHQEVPAEEAAVKSSGKMKKRHRGRYLAAGRRGEPNELTRQDCGSRRKLAAACRKVSRHAAVIWRKKNVFRKIRTQGNCGPRKELAAAGRKTTHHAEVAQRKGRGLQGRSHEGPSVEQGRRKNHNMNKFERGTRKGRTLRRRQLMRQEGTNGTRNRDFEKQLRLGSERTTSGIHKKTIGLEIVKRAVGISSRLRKIRNWTLWRGRPPL